MFGYWMLGKKWMSPVKLLLMLFIGGIILHNLGIIA
jgi:mannose/fructose/N-acetylgalactosamine-specific phosphotransferase system component IID